MSSYTRPRRSGASIFFTINLADRGGDLLVGQIAALRCAVLATRAERPFAIDAWVVMPDHMHCVWSLPEGDADYSTRMAAIKARFSRGLPAGHLRSSHITRREKGIWQRRFWEHHIRNEAELQACIRYCWINPVKHGYVKQPEDWPYSSFHREHLNDLIP